MSRFSSVTVTFTLTLLLSFATASALAGEAAETVDLATADAAAPTLKGYRFGACDSWQRVQGSVGSGYACNFWPTSIVVADGYDTANALTAAEKRIAELEERVMALEKKVGGGK